MKRLIILFLSPFIIIGISSFFIVQKSYDMIINLQAKKPLPFNHQDHLPECEARKCETCHK
ncbi:MAG: hypothetical protein SVZ03_17600, partial [Spirochaetota bacterium]|nr:hypothetical protein [Spirochaetota bacterium]